MTLRTDDLDFELDPARIARQPTASRADARMLVVDLDDGGVAHRRVRDIGEYLRRGDQLVINSTRVMAARFQCTRTDTGGRLEGLLLEEHAPGRWWSMLRKSRRLRPGHTLQLLEHDGSRSQEVFRVLEVEDGRVLLELEGDHPVQEVLARLGSVPLPPYIRNARRDMGEPLEDPRDAEWYQTVYAHQDGPTRSVAAPTAGLHLSQELLAGLAEAGVGLIEVELEVGAGTFKPVEAEVLDDHPMHRERCVVPPSAVAALRALQVAREEGQGR
ncbi:MAG: S-adenosylmethionine:tRNA ribosyltransferase-isomerase, partial [Phycisphaerales bacterium]|nr:S-adenosylmethionine:tRNA ribosyltransferase-isomerase [Phycisphaerales bacterium]